MRTERMTRMLPTTVTKIMVLRVRMVTRASLNQITNVYNFELCDKSPPPKVGKNQGGISM